jgi:hypothetical protein
VIPASAAFVWSINVMWWTPVLCGAGALLVSFLGCGGLTFIFFPNRWAFIAGGTGGAVACIALLCWFLSKLDVG